MNHKSVQLGNHHGLGCAAVIHFFLHLIDVAPIKGQQTSSVYILAR